jgi:DNA invertase Pin-like site-specific DNA recombinase
MKKAVLYARVSSDLQKKERTIESQIAVLKAQIKAAGDVLVKEYIDDGYSGARLDRPALDELRHDLKAPLFDSIYFLNTDRIARDVTYQIIIIGEILKQRKRLIINGRDYVENPENKFTLTVLGAVAELERAKIIERASRGRQQRLSQGYLLGCGNNLYGYDYHRRTPSSPPRMTCQGGRSPGRAIRLLHICARRHRHAANHAAPRRHESAHQERQRAMANFDDQTNAAKRDVHRGAVLQHDAPRAGVREPALGYFFCARPVRKDEPQRLGRHPGTADHTAGAL